MTHHVLAVFETPNEASLAADRLVSAGVPDTAISVVVGEGYHAENIAVEADNKGAEGAATGATIGGVLGGVAGALAATGAVVASGGTVLVAGPVAAALAGVGAGGASGGIVGGLLGLGVPEHHVKAYEDVLDNDGGLVLGVEVNDETKGDVKKILKDAGGKAVSTE